MGKKTIKEKRKGFKIFLIIFIITIIIIAKTGYKNTIISKIKSFYNNSEIISNVKSIFKVEKTFEVIETIPISSEEKVELYNNIIIKKDNEKIEAFDLEGQKKWEKNIDFDEELVFLGNNFIYLCDKGTGSIQILKDNGEISHTIETNPQLSGIVEKDDNLLLLFKGENKENLVIMDKDREILGNATIKRAHIFSATINSNKTKYAFSTFKTKDGNMSNYLYIYSIDGEKIKDMDFGENLILYIDFVADDSIVVLTAGEIFYLKDGEVFWTKEFRNGEDIFIDKEKGEIYLLYEKSIKVLSPRGEVIKEIDLAESYKKIIPFDKDKLILYGDEYILILDENREILIYKNEEKINKLKVKNSNVILLDSDKINIMDIKNKF